jgi:hypothetical protein
LISHPLRVREIKNQTRDIGMCERDEEVGVWTSGVWVNGVE